MSTGQETQSVIASDVEINGTIRSTGSVRIDGKLEGELTSTGDAVIGKSAQVKGNVSANSVTIEGTIQGNITAKDKIEMKSTARVTGDISAKRLAVEDGVTFVGKSEVNPAKAPQGAAVPPRVEPAAEKAEESRGGGMFARR
jgi:cytoskeletal protein CcmA (bactofilin family)